MRKPRTRSIFRMLMLPLLVLLMVEMALLAGGLTVGGVIDQINCNAESILTKQVENRNSYLQRSMVSNWAELSLLSETVNFTTQQMLDAGELSLDNLDSDSNACAPLLLQLTDDLVSTLYAKKVSGIFIVFNTHDLSLDQAQGTPVNKTGICIRDNDPNAPPSSYRADLLLERAPIAVVRSLNISTDAAWFPVYPFSTREAAGYYDFLYQPFQAAYTSTEAEMDASDFGYWSTEPYMLCGTDAPTISYTIPLILDDGTVYGVLGVELLESHLREMLPGAELVDDKQGAYILAVDLPDTPALQIRPVLVNGATLQQVDLGDGVTLTPMENSGYTFTAGGYEYFAGLDSISLYNSNTPFSNQKWYLIGAVRTDQLYAFSRQISTLLVFVGFTTLLVGFLGTIFISRRLSRPIWQLSKEVARAQRDSGSIPLLSATGITEIDRFSSAITSLSQDVVDASTRLLRIMDMASVDLGGFELRQGDEKVFVTDNFFPMMGQDDVDTSHLTAEGFLALRKELNNTLLHSKNSDGSVLFQVPLPQGGIRYVRLEVAEDAGHIVGLAEDVTSSTLERLRIEHDRDYDLLTGLLNRRAFYREAELLFKTPKALGHAAVLMLDLDNLKSINDRFGHDWGDQYIRRAGQCFSRGVPNDALCARVSGDEFFIVFSGYANREQIRAAISNLRSAILASTFTLPSGEVTRVCASGGVAWYPDDSTDFNELIKFADFAMYQMKQTHKGQVGDFDLGVYNQESFLTQNRREFQQLLDEALLTYHFQPIVSAKTGKCAAYEALMRVNLPTLRSPEPVLKLAREQGRLVDIEHLTWFKSNEVYESLLCKGLVDPEALLFINSIASQRLSLEAERDLAQRYHHRLDRFVIEITEGEDMNPLYTQAKREAFGRINMLALDDYGSGYNSEKNLLEISPQFIKVDISIVRNIDSDPNKQAIVSNIVSYAHPRGMQIIAEGLETASEVETVLRLGVDLLQGYFLARPGAVPPAVSQAALDLISSFHCNHA